MTVKTFRQIASEGVRAVCIREGWYTNGTNEDYTQMLEFVDEHREAKDQDILNIALDIYAHSDFEGYSSLTEDEGVLSNICYVLLNDATYHFMEVIEMEGASV